FTLRDGIEYVAWGVDAGLDIDRFVPRISFFFNAHNDFFEEIAKYRAARRIWAREMKQRFGSEHPRTLQLRFHTQTAGVSLTVQQPLNNIVRVAIQALAGVLGGTQSLHTDAYDEALALPTDRAAHATDHRRRDWCCEHDRSARWFVLPRSADRKDGAGSTRVLPQDRCDGWNGCSDRKRFSATRDSGLRLSLSESGGERRAGDRRCEQVCDD